MTDLDERWTDVADRMRGLAHEVPVRRGSIESVERRARARDRHRLMVVSVGCVVAVAMVAVAVVRDGRRTSTVVDSVPSTAATESTSTATGSTVISPLVEDELARLGRPLRRDDTGLAVTAAQAALSELGYDAGDSGVFDERMEQAVLAFEGLALERTWQQQTGQLTGDEVIRLLRSEYAAPAPLRPDPDHTEIRLDRQALVVYRDGAPAFIAHISSGSGEQWCDRITLTVDDRGNALAAPEEKDLCGVAKTPSGVFQFYRKVAGQVQGPYGGMADPVYFNYGITVHGAVNVPREPVSRGAVRIPLDRSAEFADLVRLKELVYVFDGVTEPEDVSRQDVLPIFDYPDPSATTG